MTRRYAGRVQCLGCERADLRSSSGVRQHENRCPGYQQLLVEFYAQPADTLQFFPFAHQWRARQGLSPTTP